MDSLLFGIVMLAMAWLVLWCCIDHSRPGKTWWPFDYRLNRPREPTSRQRIPVRGPPQKPSAS